MNIRPATRGDIDAVLAFWRVATTVESSTDDPGGIAALLDFDAEALLVAVAADGEVVGTVIGGWDGWRGTMYRLAVHPRERRQGIASLLVAEAERRLVTRGARRLHLIVVEDEPDAAGFWRAMGYAPTEQTRFVKTLSHGR
ncbi:MAG TPA: GNAT family N-acetyltransferase [Acidimicrobiia bacterium]